MDNLTVIEKEIISHIDATQLMDYNKEIAKEVRLSGSEEELRAFKYVQHTLESFGIETELSYHEAYISLPGKTSLKIDGTELTCITHSMAPSTTERGISGETVYIGDYSNDKLSFSKGKVAVVEGIASPEVIAKVSDAGGLAAIFINGPYTHEMIVSTVWGSPTPENISQMPKIPVVSINDDTGVILKQFMKEGKGQVELYTEVETKWTAIPTLTADIKGKEESDHFVLFSGHIDSWHYGAMDNGSANATMLEVARVLSKYKEELKRSIRFAFWSGHSHGRYAGSQAYCDRHWEEIHENCVMHIYIDSVGGKGATILSESNCMSETKDLASHYVKKITGQNYIGSRYGKYADQSFWGAGVPSLFMGMSEQPLSNDPMSQKVFQVFAGKEAGGFGWWWHTVEDTIDKIDPTNLKRDCEIYALSIYKVLTDAILPINQLAAVKEIKDTIKEYQTAAGDKVDLNITVERLNKLEEVLTNAQSDLSSSNLSIEKQKEINKIIMAISRNLVPLNYVSTDIFEHDAAIRLSPIPSLSSINRIAALEKGTHDYFLWRTSINRLINKVNYLLKNALEEASKLLTVIEKRSGNYVSN
ncbi:M28 family peptidase [Mesobacillus thioparans]|uniref:M28 family peptidase n=1 Tax=Mesobacillus thioparans TaxID=370439 RepID=UPI0039F0D2DD